MASSACKRRPGGKYCCIPGCNGSSNNGEKVFLIPKLSGKRCGKETKDWAEKFHQIIFRYRFDTSFKTKVQSGKSYICSKHFTDSDVLGHQRSKLRFGSLPSLNLPEKSHSTKEPEKRRFIMKHALPDKEEKSILTIPDVMRQWTLSQPRGWRLHKTSTTTVHLTYYKSEVLHATPSVSLLITEKDAGLQFSISYNGIYAIRFSQNLKFGSKSLRVMLQDLLDANVCPGYDNIPDDGTGTTGWSYRLIPCVQGNDVMLVKRYFSDDCMVAHFGIPSVCVSCMASHVRCIDNLQRRLQRKEKNGGLSLSMKAPLSLCKPERLQATILANRKRIHTLQKELKESGLTVTQSVRSVMKGLKDGTGDGFLREWWSVQKQLHENISKNGRRYPPSVIRYCMKLYAKSPSAYRLAGNVMILPSPRTIRGNKLNLLDRCKIGFQNHVASRISQAIRAAENYHDQFVVVCIDEMAIKEDLVYQASSGTVLGYVDFGNDDVNDLSSASQNVASHMLTFLIRGVTNCQLDGIIAYYPTTGANCDELSMLLARLLIEIPKKTSVTIIGVVFDGLAANRSVIKRFCRTEESGEVQYRMENPVDPSRYIYFVPDPPHLLKTVRNNLLNTKKCMWNQGYITIEPIKNLIREDVARWDLRFYPHLNESHISPTTWEKMNVKMAAQTLSCTIGTALRQDHPALSRFILMIDKWFDIMNAGFHSKRKFKHVRLPFYSVEDLRLRWLEIDFLNYLKDWHFHANSRELSGDVNRSLMLLSIPTDEGLRIATKSMIALVKECLQMGAEYVLPRRVNQDPLEAYFGMQRQRVARDDAPSVGLFSANARSAEVVKKPNTC